MRGKGEEGSEWTPVGATRGSIESPALQVHTGAALLPLLLQRDNKQAATCPVTLSPLKSTTEIILVVLLCWNTRHKHRRDIFEYHRFQDYCVSKTRMN